jgi:hypothetical protein
MAADTKAATELVVKTQAAVDSWEAFEVKSARIRMEARREAQSEVWEVILRTAGGHVDFDRDDLVALEKRAQAEFDRTCKAKAAEKAREETEEDRAERAAEYQEDARKWSCVVEDLLWRLESDTDDD